MEKKVKETPAWCIARIANAALVWALRIGTLYAQDHIEDPKKLGPAIMTQCGHIGVCLPEIVYLWKTGRTTWVMPGGPC